VGGRGRGKKRGGIGKINTRRRKRSRKTERKKGIIYMSRKS
jgi:hypothetical protein